QLQVRRPRQRAGSTLSSDPSGVEPASDSHSMRDPRYDMIVVGGGINGAAIAREAALGGFAVLLLDQADIASGTTSASTRLIHGGLRYLEHLELGLVRESLAERE